MSDVVIVSAARTPVGSFNGALASLPAHELGRIAIQAAVERAGIQASDVDEVVLGQVLTAGAGQNPARQAAVKAGLPYAVPSLTLNTKAALVIFVGLSGCEVMVTVGAIVSTVQV